MSENQSSAHPALTLDVRLRGSKCATRELASKLHLGSPICALRDISQLIASHESTRPWGRHWCFAIGCCLEDHTILCKPNYLAELLSRQSFRGRCWGVLLKIVIWLILPVVIRLSQRLSHACLSISIIQRNCEWLIKTVMVYLIIEFYMDNRGNSRANTCWCAWLFGRAVFIR